MGKLVSKRQQPPNDPLDYGAIEALVAGRHGAPFDVLGRHVTMLEGERVTIIRAFVPGATAMWVAPQPSHSAAEAGGAANGAAKKPLPMKRLRPEGLFSLALLGEPFSV